jgi:hypothetical protein
MNPDHIRKKILAQPPESPLKGKQIPINKEGGLFDVSTELSGYGLQGVHVTDDELLQLVEELGLGGEDAGELVKGLGGSTKETKDAPKKESEKEVNESKVDDKKGEAAEVKAEN